MYINSTAKPPTKPPAKYCTPETGRWWWWRWIIWGCHCRNCYSSDCCSHHPGSDHCYCCRGIVEKKRIHVSQMEWWVRTNVICSSLLAAVKMRSLFSTFSTLCSTQKVESIKRAPVTDTRQSVVGVFQNPMFVEGSKEAVNEWSLSWIKYITANYWNYNLIIYTAINHY